MKKKYQFRFRLFVADEYQPLRVVPLLLWAALIFGIGAQVAFTKYLLPPPLAKAEELRIPPSQAAMQLTALGDPTMFSRVIMLSLQGNDNQRGASVPFRELDYDIIGKWLDRIVALDERSDYPHHSAAKIYGVVNEDSRRYKMVRWVRRHFNERPEGRWEWMAFSTNLANYILKDEALGLEMARELRQKTSPLSTPVWARQLEILFIENAGDYKTAANMLRQQMLDGEVAEGFDYKFVYDRLTEMLEKMVGRGDITEEEMRRTLDEIDAAQNDA